MCIRDSVHSERHLRRLQNIEIASYEIDEALAAMTHSLSEDATDAAPVPAPAPLAPAPTLVTGRHTLLRGGGDDDDSMDFEGGDDDDDDDDDDEISPAPSL